MADEGEKSEENVVSDDDLVVKRNSTSAISWNYFGFRKDDGANTDEISDSCCDEEITSSKSEERQTAQTFSCITCGKTLSSQRHLERHERKHTEQKLFTCTRCKISFTTLQEHTLHYSKVHRVRKKRQFHCEQCDQVCPSVSKLKVHMRTHSGETTTFSLEKHERKHTEQKLFTCTRCKISFTTLQEHTLHYSKVHRVRKKRQFHCEQCDQVCPSVSKLKVHMRTHSGETPTFSLEKHEHTDQKLFTCKRCELTFNTLRELRLHSKVHREKKHCEQCGKGYLSSTNLKVHMMTHSGERPFHCSKCDMRFRTRNCLVGHERFHTGEKPYKCPHCEKRFSQKAYLKKHVFLHTNERPYQCSQCDKAFRDSSCLKSHQKIHSEEKPYQCSYCDKRFRYKSNLISHERVHTGEKPYLCSYCGKSFSCSGTFKDHQRVHTGEKPYQCNVCGKSFTKHYSLVSHRKTHTGERPYKCSQCEKTFTQAVLLRIHLRVHTGEKPYHCSICGEGFANIGPFKTHQKKHVQNDLTNEKDFVQK